MTVLLYNQFPISTYMCSYCKVHPWFTFKENLKTSYAHRVFKIIQC